ncbi:hypothetical protein ANO11243_049940 [Dothideomycetidae sp. 11243]|nr:hypothetical protein ANO11243_049940 [fungal sp. No.11243]
MATQDIPADFPFTLLRADVLDAQMAYVDTAPRQTSETEPVVVLIHGNPTSSYLWRNIIPHVSGNHRCIALDLIGMGASDKLAHLQYRFLEHALYLDEFLATVLPPSQPVVLVLHDWGSALGFHWARRNAHRVVALAFMEFVIPFTWKMLEIGGGADAFRTFRGPPEVGRKLIIDENFFIEKFLPGGVVRALSEEEMGHYRAPYLEPSSREPLYRWPNEVPIEGTPADVAAVVEKYHRWLLETEVPKLMFHATPGVIIGHELAQYYSKTLKNVVSIDLGPGRHWIKEDNPHLIGSALAEWLRHTVAPELKN